MHGKFTSLVTLIVFSVIQFATAQSQTPLDQTLRYLEQNKRELGLSTEDLSDWTITDQYTSKHNQVSHIYMVQQHQGIKVFNAMITSNVQNGKVLHLNNKFISDAGTKINSTTASLSSLDAVEKAAQHLNITLPANLSIKDDRSKNHVIYEKNGVALEPIHSELVYQPLDDRLILAWDVYIAQLDGQHAWRMRLDAATGEVLEKHDLVIHCNFSHHEDDCMEDRSHSHLPKEMSKSDLNINAKNFGMLPNTYTVLAPPIESPSHGSFSPTTSTGDLIASPNGWHNDGSTDYTITRGNNVHAYQDRNGNNNSSNDEPDGGATLEFDAPFNQANEPSTYDDAAVINLFFWNNYIHDVFYNYGFDGISGNFQADNNAMGGLGSDEVLAEAQDGADTGSRNNANFSSGFSDGANGRMQMFLWDRDGAVAQLFTVNSPASIAGSYNAGTANFGAPVTATPLTGDMVLADDGVGTTSDACEPLTDDYTGKIVMIDRGICEFGSKALNAETQGAIAVIICNNVVGGTVTMGAGDDGASVTIPLVSLSLDDCNTIKMELGNGINITLIDDAGGPEDYDGDFDNGIIAHEYGHGISTRLTGGPSSSCLNNDEQAGEGWSDFFGLILTHEAGDLGTDARGIGTYVQRTDVNGGGIRRSVYSTDINVNAQDYDDIRGTIGDAPHPVGEIMCATLWDLYWNMIDVYGYDTDIYTGTGGNNLAIQLVIDGLKMQGCSPGFLDVRDAILAADMANNGGANECLIWRTFARRGMGVDAIQGSTNSRNDGIPNFDKPEDCVEELKIRKTATANVTTDDDITYTVTVINDSGQNLTGVVVEDESPAGTFFVQGSITGPNGTLVGNMVTWNIGNMADDEELTLTYKVNPAQTPFTTVAFEDGFEDGLDNWVAQTNTGNVTWNIDQGLPNTGLNSAFASNPDAESDQGLQTFDFFEMSSTRPALIFSHYHDTERSFDGGTVEFLDESNVYNDLGDQFIRNGYPGELTNNLLDVEVGFSGKATLDDSYIESIVDMTDYAGQNGFFRFRMTSDDNTGATGWFVDDVKFVNLYTISGSDACLTSNEIATICAPTPQGGTVIYEGTTSIKEELATFELNIFPNPTTNQANIQVEGAINGEATLSVIAVDGKVMKEIKMNGITNDFNLDVSSLSAGIYMVQLATKEATGVTKLVIQ